LRYGFFQSKNEGKIEVMFEPRSLVIISGKARHNGTHGIAARKQTTLTE
jgi:alkylated DNA repair dioxygenase AlkB